MNKLVRKAVVLGLTVVTLFAGAPAVNAQAADNEPVHTRVVATGKTENLKITYSVNVDKTAVTDGRVIVTYDKDVLTLKSASEGIRFSDADVNKEYEENGETGVAYAFVNDCAKNASGTLLQVKFEVKKDLPGQDTTIKTTVVGLNNAEKEVLSNVVLEDTVTVGKQDLKVPELTALDQTLIGVNVKWTKDPNADGYIVYRSTSKNGKYSKIGVSIGNSFWDIALKNNTTYYYKIQSYRGNGVKREYSDDSNILSILVKKFKLG